MYRLPREHRLRMKSTNMLERYNEELRRRTRVVRIFPNAESCLRLILALAAETHERWLTGQRYLYGRTAWFAHPNRNPRHGRRRHETPENFAPSGDPPIWAGLRSHWKLQKILDTTRLKGVVSNSRFLILPWVRVPYLASKVLSMAVRRLPGDWKERNGLEPVLAETFVDPAKYRGTCYRAANWKCMGRTKGRKASASEAGRTPKDVYLYPLTKDWKQVLLTGSRRSGRRSRRPPVVVLAPEDAFVRLWSGIVEMLVGVSPTGTTGSGSSGGAC